MNVECFSTYSGLVEFLSSLFYSYFNCTDTLQAPAPRILEPPLPQEGPHMGPQIFVPPLYTSCKAVLWAPIPKTLALSAPKGPSSDEWINEVWFMLAEEYFEATRRHEVLAPATIWINFKTIMTRGRGLSKVITLLHKGGWEYID